MRVDMQRHVTIAEYEVLIEAEQHRDPYNSANGTEYAVHYSIARTDGRSIRDGLASVHSYDLIKGNDYFSRLDAALDYGEAKARDDIENLVTKADRTRVP